MCNGSNMYLAASDRTTSLKDLSHFVVVKRIAEVLDVDIRELLGSVAHHVNTLTTRHETADESVTTISTPVLYTAVIHLFSCLIVAPNQCFAKDKTC